MFPQRQKILYGEDAMIEETFVSQIHANPAFEEGFFDGLSENETDTTPSPPEKDPSYGHALLGEYWSNMLWAGPYRGHLGNLSVVHPAADLPGVYHLTFLDTPNVAQLVLEFEDSVIVFESPPQQSELVIQWVGENLGKPISHLWVSFFGKEMQYPFGKTIDADFSPPRRTDWTSCPIIIMIILSTLPSLSRLERLSSFPRWPRPIGSRFPG